MPSAKAKMKQKTQKKNKGKRWKKGQSSSSNPETRKHRESARNNFFNQNTGSGGLTTEALTKHDKLQQHGLDDDENMSDNASDQQSMAGKTFNTWASNWTDCTNATFSKVHRYWNSGSSMHKEVLAVLAAVTEVIKEKGGKETETEYFAALVTTLETVDTDDSLTAVAYLLSLAIKRVPVPVLRSKFSDVAKTLMEILANHMDSESTSLLRSVIVCLASLLRIQEQASWNSASTVHIYNGLLSLICHPKPKVRKASHQAVRLILKGSVFMTQIDPPPHHPAASTTAKYCIQQIEESGGSSESSGTLHTLGLLKEIMAVFPHNSLKSTCETILRVMTLSNVMITSVSMQCLHGMFLAHPSAKNLPSELNAQIITALYDYQPGENDTQPMAAWLAVMEVAHIHLQSLDEKLCLSHLPRLFTTCMNCLQSEKIEVAKAASKSIQRIFKDCMTPMSEQIEAMLSAAQPGTSTAVHKIIKSVEGGLSYQYHKAWDLVMQILTQMFESVGKQCQALLKKCLLSMADLRDSHRFPYKVELETAIGMAVRKLGPKFVLSAIPIDITGEEDNYDFPRSWLLPVLRENIRETELGFFTSFFLPLAAKLRAKSLQYAKENRVVEWKTYDALQMQIWSLLPGFCIKPTDLQQSFKGIAKILGSALTDRPDLKMDILASLRKLIQQNLDHEENRTELAKFAKNYMPLLFNLFTTPPEQEKDMSRLAVLETVKVYVQIADTELVESFFDKCVTKIQEKDVAAFRRHALMDLGIVMVPHVRGKRLQAMLPYVLKQLGNITDHTVQKKSYRILEEICSCQSAEAKVFVAKNIEKLQQVLLKSLSTSSPSSKAPRLRCLIHMVKQLESDHTDFVTAMIPEAILCTKETAERARTSAYTLLVEMGSALTRWSSKPQTEVLEEYFKLIMAGFAGNPHMVSTTALALTRILFEYKAHVTGDMLQHLINATHLLLAAKAREIVSATLVLLKVLISIFPEMVLGQHLNDIVSSLVAMKEDNKHHFRFKAKEIFARLIRKFGYDTVYRMVPQSHTKMLANIKKTQERSKKKKKQKEDEEDGDDKDNVKSKPESIDDLLRDTDSELEDEDSGKQKGKKKKKETKPTTKKGTAWLKEGGDEDIVDFLDPSVSKKVLATKPSEDKESKQSVKHDFKMASDGRLIITEGLDEDGEKKKKAEVIDDLDELLDAMEGHSSKGRKRKMRLEDDDDEDTPMKYKAGGSGIHRPVAVAKKKKENQPQNSGSDFKAKKAGGDMKRKDKQDPFAYVPLEFKNLNKRKKAKVAGQFTNLVKGAKKGAAKGRKMKKK